MKLIVRSCCVVKRDMGERPSYPKGFSEISLLALDGPSSSAEQFRLASKKNARAHSSKPMQRALLKFRHRNKTFAVHRCVSGLAGTVIFMFAVTSEFTRRRWGAEGGKAFNASRQSNGERLAYFPRQVGVYKSLPTRSWLQNRHSAGTPLR